MKMRFVAIGAPMLALSACGGGSGGSGSAVAAGGGSWKATDACAILDQSVVAATLASAVSSAELSAVKKEGDGADLYSQCAYKLADGRMLVFGTGQATNGASVADQVKEMRRQAAMMTDKPPVDLPGVGKAALWSPEVHALYAFLGDGRFVSATLSQLDFTKPQPATEKVQTDEIALIRKAGG